MILSAFPLLSILNALSMVLRPRHRFVAHSICISLRDMVIVLLPSVEYSRCYVNLYGCQDIKYRWSRRYSHESTLKGDKFVTQCPCTLYVRISNSAYVSSPDDVLPHKVVFRRPFSYWFAPCQLVFERNNVALKFLVLRKWNWVSKNLLMSCGSLTENKPWDFFLHDSPIHKARGSERCPCLRHRSGCC